MRSCARAEIEEWLLHSGKLDQMLWLSKIRIAFAIVYALDKTEQAATGSASEPSELGKMSSCM